MIAFQTAVLQESSLHSKCLPLLPYNNKSLPLLLLQCPFLLLLTSRWWGNGQPHGANNKGGKVKGGRVVMPSMGRP